MSVLWTVFYVMYSFVVCANVVRDMGCFWVRCSELSYVFCMKFLTHPRPFPKGRESLLFGCTCCFHTCCCYIRKPIPDPSQREGRTLLLKSALCSRTFNFDFRYFTSRSLSSIWEGLSFGSRYSNKPQIIHKCI